MDRRTLVSEANEGHIQFLFSLFGSFRYSNQLLKRLEALTLERVEA